LKLRWPGVRQLLVCFLLCLLQTPINVIFLTGEETGFMSFADIWPLLDTALKVGLGGAIVLATLWFYQRKQSLESNTANFANRRLALLEEISAAVGNVNHCFARYSALVIESTKFGKNWPAAR